jgi:hypothetical protein
MLDELNSFTPRSQLERDRRCDWNIDFDRLNRYALSDRRIMQHVARKLVPGGELKGDEYIVSRVDNWRRSLKVLNLATGQWVDLKISALGSDVIGFVARSRVLTDREAAQLIGATTGTEWRKFPPP